MMRSVISAACLNIGQLAPVALGALIALIGTRFTASAARKRERDAARRSWLGEALANFYSPVVARLELAYRWDERVRRELADAGAKIDTVVIGTQLFPATEHELMPKLIAANLRIQREITQIVQENLHYVDSSDLQNATFDYLTEIHVNVWYREVAGLEDEPSQGWVVMNSHKERSHFHQLVKDAFENSGVEFRQLSQDAGSHRWRRIRRRARNVKLP